MQHNVYAQLLLLLLPLLFAVATADELLELCERFMNLRPDPLLCPVNERDTQKVCVLEIISCYRRRVKVFINEKCEHFFV